MLEADGGPAVSGFDTARWQTLWSGKAKTTRCQWGVLVDISLTLPKNKNRKVEIRVIMDQLLVAPIASGAAVGSVVLYDSGQNS